MNWPENRERNAQLGRYLLTDWCREKDIDPKGLFSDLERNYSTHPTGYHTLEGHVLPLLPDLLRCKTKHQTELIAAWLFHDAVYLPRRHDNELMSARELVSAIEDGSLRGARRVKLDSPYWVDVSFIVDGFDDHSMRLVEYREEPTDFFIDAKLAKKILLATKHDREPTSLGERLIVDCDLAILGAPREEFIAYEQAIRKEYSFVPSFLFRKKRAEILEQFLERPRIYTSGHFDDLEERARENLRWSIDRLRSRRSLLKA